jgi:serine/threonine-protein kinase
MRRRARLAALAGVLALLVVIAALWVAGSLRGAPAPAPAQTPAAPAGPTFEQELAAARAALTDGRAKEARALLERLAKVRPGEPELDRLLGHAWLDEGDAPQAVEAWSRAQAAGQPLDAASLEHLAGLLTRDKPVSDRAARLLVRGGRDAGPALNGAIAHGGTLVKLRALAVAREIGPSVDVDVLGGYQALLGDADCDVRKAAARGLGDLGDRRALPRLKERAAERNEKRGLFGVLIESKPVCGAAEAGEAVRKLEAVK